jgi:prophage regulatory protein
MNPDGAEKVQLVNSNTPQAPATPAPTEAKPDRLIRLAEVETLTGLKKSSLYSLTRAGKFVTPIRLSSRCTAWSLNSVQAWIQARITEAEAQQ